jgi:NADPH-dependent 2,4-dienoyl-CoA reductase/sulfur reductase-like enzyme/nitrite reductase/ring-hydroxylating ferredoxin subunit
MSRYILRSFHRPTFLSLSSSSSSRFFHSTIMSSFSEFKLKGITNVNLKNGQTQEVEVEGVEGGKVLLAKVQDEIHALSPKCTHFGAPLSKGVLTPDGRLTCPWHGACFNVKTGDIEDAPAPDPLQKFEIIQKEGAVYIKGTEADIKGGRRTLNIKCKAQGQDHVVIVGRGSGAFGAIDGLRGGGFTGKITSIAVENHPPIDRTKLSKALLGDASKLALRSSEYYQESDVDLITDTVTSVDFNGKKVQTQSGKAYDYTKLILASGGTANQLPLPGLKGDLKNVFLLRTINHVQDILQAVGEDGSKKIVVIGSSFIGMEVGNALAGKKHDVSIIGMEKEPIARVMGEKVGAVFRQLLEKNGVKFYMGASVDKGVESTTNPGFIGSVALKDGTSLEADIVIEGVGVRPSTDYLKENSHITLEKDRSIAVDESFTVKGLKDVYAVGDIATYPYHGPGGNGNPVRIEHWNVAQNAGRSVAQTILQPGSKPKPFIPVFWSALGAQLRYCGHTPEGFDHVIVHGNTDVSEGKQSFIAYYTKGEEIVAVATMMKDPYMVQAAELMRRGGMPKKSEVEKGVDIMEIGVPAEVKI